MNAMFNNNQWDHLKLKGNNGTKESKLIYLLKNFFKGFPVNLLEQSQKTLEKQGKISSLWPKEVVSKECQQINEKIIKESNQQRASTGSSYTDDEEMKKFTGLIILVEVYKSVVTNVPTRWEMVS